MMPRLRFRPLSILLLILAGGSAEALIRLASISASMRGATRAIAPIEALLAGAILALWLSFDRNRLAVALSIALIAVATIERWPDLRFVATREH